MKQNAAKLLSTLLALCMVLAMLPGTALAAEVTYAVEGGNLYFDTETGTITRCDESVATADIPNTINGVAVTSIGEVAFFNCSSLTSVTIPDSVTSIARSAFGGCSSLTSVSIPDSVISIGASAFSDCSSLANVTIPDSVTSIEASAFYDCSSLTNVTIPDSVTSIGDAVFAACSSLTSMAFPDGITSVGAHEFEGCSSLTSVTIPDSVTSIGEWAFGYCNSLTNVTIPDGVTSIDTCAFFSCSILPGVTIPNSATSIGSAAFAGCDSLTSVTIPDTFTSIVDGAFSSCDSLTSVTIPNSVTSIGLRAFFDCNKLTDVYFSGSQAEWEKISLDEGNEPLQSATIHYNSTSPAPSTPNAPQQTPATPAAAPNSVSVTVNGNAVQWPDATPFIDENSRTMVPLRAVADAIGLDVSWDGNTKEASFARGDKTITFPIGSNTARGSDGTTVTMNTAAVVVSGRTYAPVRYLAEFFGYQVDWDGNTRTVIIKGAEA